MSRTYDVVVYGATGFTGKLVCRYLASHPESPRWALGGRNQAKLKKLRADLGLSTDVGTLEADSTKYNSLVEMAKQVSVVINLAGPYRKNNADNVVKACVEAATSYVDLSGETGFNATLIDRYHLEAQAKGIIIAPSVGFDSLPFDLSTYLAVQHAKKLGGPASEVLTADCGIVVKGGVSSGTISSAIDMHHDPAQLSACKPDWLSPVVGSHTSTHYLSHYFAHFNKYGAITPFTPHNHRIVNRSWGLLQQAHADEAYGKTFQYQDGAIVPARPIAWFASFMVGLIGWSLGHIAIFRWLLTSILPENGGPSPSKLENGMMRVETLARTKKSAAVCTMKAKGDPGYTLTSRMIVETALTIAREDRARCGPLAAKGGVLTSATLGAEVLASRLEKFAGFQIQTVEWDGESRKTR
ncbi:uncharacterized protein PFL1_05695 [Pseudozyma flocculosa PF-1]|uniref:Saccharopine dehydrogenase NADP binding domain-containing protein n=2 Tax=Pseudozyma flocculosa TaxID=84751 RepID=A0A5C3F963_9BASI|nr:uncharacterized protein PFL1_05695 [Pseudozyma flocculosa PF-1]EPQ26716.1 hypothetical protein PFL1_05695 [Pseudozyma flocculosa PF-1]SPO40962.1 uncharacterized protein PSFLO_06444 [Pseudozyma flocculosa]